MHRMESDSDPKYSLNPSVFEFVDLFANHFRQISFCDQVMIAEYRKHLMNDYVRGDSNLIQRSIMALGKRTGLHPIRNFPT